MVKKTLADDILADLFRYQAWRAEVCSDPEGSIGADLWRKLSDAEKTTIQNIACGTQLGGKMTIEGIETELATINRKMLHYVTD
jgi:hypothetical protein